LPWPDWVFDLSNDKVWHKEGVVVAIGRYSGRRLSACVGMSLPQLKDHEIEIGLNKTKKAPHPSRLLIAKARFR
jgi:hypothetical protein